MRSFTPSDSLRPFSENYLWKVSRGRKEANIVTGPNYLSQMLGGKK